MGSYFCDTSTSLLRTLAISHTQWVGVASLAGMAAGQLPAKANGLSPTLVPLPGTGWDSVALQASTSF
jgi:hypothetical protein